MYLVVPVELVVPCPLTVGAVVTVPLGDWAGFDEVVFGTEVRDGSDGVRFESPLAATRSASRAGGAASGDSAIGVAFECPAGDSGACEFAAFEPRIGDGETRQRTEPSHHPEGKRHQPGGEQGKERRGCRAHQTVAPRSLRGKDRRLSVLSRYPFHAPRQSSF